jgi:hypothetical protein
MAFLCDGCKRVVSQANDEHSMISQFWKFAFPTLGCIAVQVLGSTIWAKGDKQIARIGAGRQLIRDAIE